MATLLAVSLAQLASFKKLKKVTQRPSDRTRKRLA